MNNIEKNLDRILISKNWNNIILRNDIRQDIIDTNDKFDERPVVEYLHNLSMENLFEIRQRVFKLARDHFLETLIRQLCKKPLLRQVSIENYASSYAFRCNIMKDVVGCLEYIILNSKTLPERCTEYSEEALNFPLGKRNLIAQLNAVKLLRYKILKHQTELQNFKKYTNGIDKLEKSLHIATTKFQKSQKQNQFLKMCLTVLLIILITFTFVFLFLNCMQRPYPIISSA